MFFGTASLFVLCLITSLFICRMQKKQNPPYEKSGLATQPAVIKFSTISPTYAETRATVLFVISVGTLHKIVDIMLAVTWPVMVALCRWPSHMAKLELFRSHARLSSPSFPFSPVRQRRFGHLLGRLTQPFGFAATQIRLDSRARATGAQMHIGQFVSHRP